jgi:ribosomal protein S18 acetylase RimI-like enzyme
LFAIGSLLFAIGSVPGYVSAAGAVGDTVTYFVGSLFFTAAAFLSYREAVDASPRGLNPEHRRLFVYQPGRIDWWATVVQLVGTVYFNVSTGTATVVGLSAQTAHQHVWRPDAIGSTCFLIASALAWYEVCHGWVAWQPRTYSWWITLVNLVGSIAFGISAVAGYVNPISGVVHNADRADTQTLIGAVCFLIGAVLLLPERTEDLSGARFRRAAATDASSVRDLVQRSYSPYVARMGRRPAPMDQDYDEVLRVTDSWVAEIDGAIVGVAVTSLNPDHLLVENLAVLPTAQGRGIGGRLLTLAENYAIDCGVDEVRLYTNESMTANLVFYPRHGYRETGRTQREGFRRVYFAKTVSAG